MAFSYLDETTLFDALKDSQKYMRPLFEPFQEFERIARNRPYPGIDKSYPKVTDGTTSSVIQKTPRRIIQQIPTGLVKSETNDWLTIVAGFILKHQIIQNANSQYAFIQKCWNAVSKALTYGAQPAYIPFVNRGEYFGTDMLLPYIKDVFLEPGKLSDADSNYIIMRSWYQTRDIEAIIANQSKLAAKGVDAGWDLAALAEIKDQKSQKDDLSTTPNERDKNNRSGGIEIYHAFQRGIGANFFSFSMKDKKVLRTWKNKDPRGEMPIHYLYADTDGSNPLGRGFCELVGSMQNLMDAEVQMYQYNRALMLNPPLVKHGDWNDSQAKFAPNVLIDLGTNPNNKLEPLLIDTTATAQFSNNYSLMKSQLLNLLASPDSVSAQAGNPNFSQTSAGVKGRKETLNVDDNYIRRQVESWLEKVFSTQLNLYFAHKEGIEDLQLDKETAGLIRETENLQPGQQSKVSPDDKIRIDFSSETPSLHFIVDPSSSEIQDDTEEIAQLKEIIADVNQNPYSMQYVQQAGKELNLGEVYKQLFMKLGLKEIEKILTEVPTGPDGQKVVTPPMAMDKPKLVIHYNDVTSPTVKAALLHNAGIQADPNDIAQSDAAHMQAEAHAKAPVNDPADPNNHPIIKIMDQLQIKFTDLPEDSKQEVLQIIGIPSQMYSPVGQNLQLQAMDQHHQVLTGIEDQQNQQSQMAQTDQQNQQDNAMAQQQQASSDQQNQAQQQLAQQQHDATVQQNQAQNQIAQQQATAQSGTPKKNKSAATAAGSTASNGANPTAQVPMPAPGGPQTPPPAPAQPQQSAQPALPSDNLNPQDHQFITQLQGLGVPDQMIGQALAMLHHNVPQDQILKMIQEAMGPQHG